MVVSCCLCSPTMNDERGKELLFDVLKGVCAYSDQHKRKGERRWWWLSVVTTTTSPLVVAVLGSEEKVEG